MIETDEIASYKIVSALKWENKGYIDTFVIHIRFKGSNEVGIFRDEVVNDIPRILDPEKKLNDIEVCD